MSHEITSTNGKAEMAYVGETPWHGLGQKLTAGASIDTWIAEAGMGWRIQRSKARYATDATGRNLREFPAQHVLFRSDTLAPLSVVGNTYQVVQPHEVLEFFRDIVSPGGFELETAGTLFGGARFWALARTGAAANVLGQDRVGGYLLLTSNCDYSGPTEGFFTTVRVVCNNTLSMALGSKAAAKARVSVRHSVRFDAKAMKDQLGIVHGAFAEFMQFARVLAARPVAAPQAADLTATLLTPKLEDDGLTAADRATTMDRTRGKDAYARILALFNGTGKGAAMQGARGTAWGWLNAVTEYADWYRKATSPDHRWAAAIDGAGADLKARAVALLTA